MRELSRRGLVVLAALLVCVSGCTDPCLAVCEEARGCPEADIEVDCDTACSEELEKAIEDAPDCEDLLEAYYSCEATQVDVCLPIAELCATERAAANDCFAG